MDYRVIDTLQNQVQGLTVEVERRHALIAARNATREAGTPEITRNILADATIQERTAKIAKEARPVLLETLATVEAGETLPGFVRDFLERLNAVAPLLSYDTAAARIWNAEAGELLARLALYFAKEGPKAAGMDNTPAAQGNAPRGPRYYLPTTKSREDLPRIFHALEKAGYIAGETPEALPDFLNAFTPTQDTTPQGRITWIWADKRTGKTSPRQILDFLTLMNGGNAPRTLTTEICAGAVPAIFGVRMDKSVPSKFYRRCVEERFSEVHADLVRIIGPE